MSKKEIKKPDLKSQAYISVCCEKSFDVFGMIMIRTFSMLILPVTEKKDTFEVRPKDNFAVQFNYNDKEGLSIEGICKCLEDMARRIRKHYKVK